MRTTRTRLAAAAIAALALVGGACSAEEGDGSIEPQSVDPGQSIEDGGDPIDGSSDLDTESEGDAGF